MEDVTSKCLQSSTHRLEIISTVEILCEVRFLRHCHSETQNFRYNRVHVIKGKFVQENMGQVWEHISSFEN